MYFSSAALTVAAALLAGPAAAMYDSQSCNGIGSCNAPADCNYYPSEDPALPEWDCGSGGTIIGQIGAGAELNFEQGLTTGQVVSRADFPHCDLIQPPKEGATLLKSNFKGVTVYGWIEYSCTETKPIAGCYFSEPNSSKTYTCKVYQNGQPCEHISKKLIGKC